MLQGYVNVPTYRLPADAPQCATSDSIEVLDSRFANMSTQAGNILWNVHTTSRTATGAANATPRWYAIDLSTTALAQTGQIVTDPGASDWNASLAVNGAGETFLNWNSNNLAKCIHPRVMYTGRQPTDPPNTVAPPSVLGGIQGTFRATQQFQGVEPWGDYSNVSIDPSAYASCPAAGRRAWIVSEYIQQFPEEWWTKIGRIGYC